MRLTRRGRFYRAGMLRSFSAEGSVRKPTLAERKRNLEELDKRIIEYIYGMRGVSK